MKITKFQHACVVVEDSGTTIVIDPGEFTRDFIMPHKVDALVITHEHPDHLDKSLIEKIIVAHPKAVIYAHESITSQLGSFTTTPAEIGKVYNVGAVELQFYGGVHAVITPSVAPPANLGVLVNHRFYYPGDSFVIPEGETPEILAVPACAPWLKIDEALTFIKAVKPQFVFPTHDAILSADGKDIVDGWLSTATQEVGAQYKRLDESSIEA